jgi:hypothetical protein
MEGANSTPHPSHDLSVVRVFETASSANIKGGSGSLVDDVTRLAVMLQAALGDGVAFDHFSLQQMMFPRRRLG